MTHGSHRFTTLSADDVALCRAHSEAIDDARESRALQRWIDAAAPLVTPVMSVCAFEVGNHMPADLPMPPSYWDDLEHWLKTLAPAKPAAPKQEQTIKVGDTVMTTYDGVATVISMGHIEVMGDIATVRLANGYEGCTSVAGLKRIPQPAQKASTHSVCIKEHKSIGFNRDIGTVLPLLPHHRSRPEYWLPCDESGWVTHVPTADAVCPVPDGLKFEVRLRDSGILCPSSNEGLRNALGVCWWRKGLHNKATECNADIIAWRPIAQS